MFITLRKKKSWNLKCKFRYGFSIVLCKKQYFLISCKKRYSETLINNVKLDGILIKIKKEIPALFTLYFKFWIALLFFFWFKLTVTPRDISFHKFFKLIQHYLKNKFVTNFPYLMDSLKLSHRLNNQILLSVTKAFC